MTITQKISAGRQFHISGYYTTMHRSQTLPGSYESKYSSEMPRYHIKFNAALFWPYRISQNVFINFRQYENKSISTVLDAKWSRRFGKWEFYFNITNLLGEDYEEIASVPMPGRQMILGMELIL